MPLTNLKLALQARKAPENPETQPRETKKVGGRQVARAVSEISAPNSGACAIADISKTDDCAKADGRADEPALIPAAQAEAAKKLVDVRKIDPRIRKIVRGAARIADRMTEEDRERAARTLRESMDAEIVTYDPKLRRLVRNPDHRTRLAATTLFLAYDEGLPVKRIQAVVHNIKGAEERLLALQESPELASAVKGAPVILEGEIIDIQQTGSAESDVPRGERSLNSIDQ